MKRVIAIALVFVAASACRKKESGARSVAPVILGNVFYTLPTPTPVPTPNPVELLRDEAARRHLRWTVWCVYWEKDSFQASAQHMQAVPHAEYTDEGRMDEWIVDDRTQSGAALALYKAIQHAPTHPAKEWFVRPTSGPDHRESCPPDITSEDFVTPTPTPHRRVWVQRHLPRRLE